MSLEGGMSLPSTFLLLPNELRIMIYRDLFSNMKVTVIGQARLLERGPGAIMRTCRQCYNECFPIFYELATISLKHETYLHVLRRKIGPHNMARLQNVEVGGFKSIPNDIVVVELPATLKKLYLRWESNMGFEPGTPKGPLNDDQIRRCIERNRQDFEKVVTKLFEKAPDLHIFFDTVVGHAPSTEVYFPVLISPQT